MNKIIFCFLLFAVDIIYAQPTWSLHSKTIAFKKVPLSNISIYSVKSKSRAISNDRGEFEIKLFEKDILIFKGKGFKELEVKVKKGRSYEFFEMQFVQNEENIESAVSSGIVSKESLVSSLQAQNDKYQITDIYEYIRKKAPGVQIVTEGGLRKFQFRGIATSMNGSNAALVLVNGIQTDDLSFLAPFDITDVTVLKDAAASEYGMRAANGVILINTKTKEK